MPFSTPSPGWVVARQKDSAQLIVLQTDRIRKKPCIPSVETNMPVAPLANLSAPNPPPKQAETAGCTNFFAVLLRCSLPLLLLLSIYLANKHLQPNESVFDGLYGFGPAVQGLVQHHRLGAIDKNYGWWCYAGRMPIVPILGAASYRLSEKMAVFLWLKNLVFWSLWIYAFFRLKRRYCIPDKWAMVTVALLLFMPYNLSIAGWADVEEGFLFALLALLFSLLLTLEKSLDALAAGLVLATIYLTKSSMLPLCVAASIWIVIKYWRSPRLVVVPMAILALATFSWGFYVQAVSGVFAFGANASSWNGWNLYKGNNPYAGALYPRISLDVLDYEDYAHKLLPSVPVYNEWDLNQAQLLLAQRYIWQNRSAVLKMDVQKLFVACCDVKESPEATAGHTRATVVLSNVISHLTLGCVLLVAILNMVRRQVSQAEILAALLTIAYVLPYFAGFLYMRHMVPIYGLMALTAAVQLTRWHARSGAITESSSDSAVGGCV
jgi:hypothetical protein